ncbi:MAG: formylglycine-generating enzyme family protein [bacterium]|nr:formylglycine-generating enzyme family protein [Candidatus Colisoma equi]
MSLRLIMSLAATLCATALVAEVPTVKNVSIRQDPGSHVVFVNYDLDGEDGYVTVEFLTNGVSVGGVNVDYVYGDVGKLVTKGNGKRISWKIFKSFKGFHSETPALSARVTAYAQGVPPDYVVIDLKTGSKTFYPSEGELPGGISNDIYRTTKLVMRRIPAAGVTARLGCTDAGEKNVDLSNDDWGKETAHNVSFTKDYYMGVFEMTLGQCKALGYTFPDSSTMPQRDFTTDVHPVGCLRYKEFRGDYNDGYNFSSGNGKVNSNSIFGMLRARVGTSLTVPGYDLPSEAQWEYACRAETSTSFNNGETFTGGDQPSESLKKIAWCRGNGGWISQRVGGLAPNAWGLYDMHGNLAEICGDRGYRTKADDPYGADVTDPLGPAMTSSENNIVVRGGHPENEPQRLRSSSRFIQLNQWSRQWYYTARVCCPADAL